MNGSDDRPEYWPEYWKGRWRRGETGWHQAEVEPFLVQAFADLPPTRVLVPLCGKTLDLAWLEAQGHEVVGVELSETACQAFFASLGREPTRSSRRGFEIYQSGRIRIYNGDFFAFTGAENPELRPLGAIYDRAALIALPRELRVRYAAHLAELAAGVDPTRFRGLTITIEREPADETGPPYSVSETELEALHGRRFAIQRVSRERVEAKAPPGSESFECVYNLVAKKADPVRI